MVYIQSTILYIWHFLIGFCSHGRCREHPGRFCYFSRFFWTKGPGGVRRGPRGPAAFAGGQGARRHSPGTKGHGGIRRGPGGQASWAPGGYRRGPRGPAAIARDQGAQRLSPGTWGLGLMGPRRLSPGGYRRGPGGLASIRTAPRARERVRSWKVGKSDHKISSLILL